MKTYLVRKGLIWTVRYAFSKVSLSDSSAKILLQRLLSKTLNKRMPSKVFFLGSTFRRIVTPQLTLVLSSFWVSINNISLWLFKTLEHISIDLIVLKINYVHLYRLDNNIKRDSFKLYTINAVNVVYCIYNLYIIL